MAKALQTQSISAPGFLKCSHCKLEKEETDFPKATNKSRGYAWICKACKKEKKLAKQASMTPEEWYLQNRRYWLKSEYGLSLEDYNELLKNQKHKCAICDADEVDSFKGLLFVDHDHGTGKVRGLLCHHCNTALGKFRDSTEILNKAIAYVEKHK